MVIEIASGKGHAKTALMNSKDLAYDFNVHACVAILAVHALTGKWQ